jgi:hypothetical protein
MSLLGSVIGLVFLLYLFGISKLRAQMTLIFLLLLVLVSIALASYRVTVSRESSNLYHILHTDRYIKTQGCFVYGSYMEAIVNESESWIYFLSQDTQCDIVRIIR